VLQTFVICPFLEHVTWSCQSKNPEAESPDSGLIVRMRASSIMISEHAYRERERERVTSVSNAGSPSDFSQRSQFLNQKDREAWERDCRVVYF